MNVRLKQGSWFAAWVLVLTTTVLLGGCERPFVENVPAETEIVLPDLSVVLSQPETLIGIAAESPRRVTQVTLNEDPLQFDAETGLWRGRLRLTPGLNTLLVGSVDEDGTAGLDTAYALYLPTRFTSAPSLPQPRAGHTATLLLDGSVLVTGGTAQQSTLAAGEAWLLPPGALTFVELSAHLLAPRSGHTATLLPNGQVLLLGGSRTDPVESISDLVETVELYDPQEGSFRAIPFRGEPIRRTRHTATVRQTDDGLLIDLYGGRGDVRYGADPRLGLRGDLRTFSFTGDSLIARNRLLTAPFLEAIDGHAEAPVRPLSPGERGRYVVAGTSVGAQVTEPISFTIDYTGALLEFDDTIPRLQLARTRHAAAPLTDGLVGFFGGTPGDAQGALATPEIYADAARRFYRLSDNATTSLRRFGHTATFIAPGRILLLGGIAPTGNVLPQGEYFIVTSTP